MQSTNDMRGRRAIITALAWMIASAAAVVSAAAAAAPPPPTSQPAAVDEFVTSYWYGPPAKFTSLERYRQIRDAHFNVVFPPGPPDASLTVADNRRILDLCQQLGLKAVIFDPRMPHSLDDPPDARAKLDAIVTDYADHPALLAYFIVDEPGAADFPRLARVNAYLKQRDPRHPGFVNLFPNCAAPGVQLGVDRYDHYLERFCATVDPFVISYDHYPFVQGGDRPEYFNNLAVVRNAAIRHHRPFWTIMQCVQHYNYRALTEPELRFQAMQALAFGSRGLLWYTYWYPGGPTPAVSHAMINHDGTPDPAYEWIKAINADARAIGEALLPAQCWATFHTGPGGEFVAPPNCPIAPAGPPEAKLTIGVFKQSDGRTLAVVANRDYRHPTRAAVRIMPVTAKVERLDPPERRWLSYPLSAAGESTSVEIAAGDALLLRW